MRARRALVVVKVVHTIVWAFMASCIVWVPLLALARRFRFALLLSLIVLSEVAVLALNRMRCPLTDVARHYTDERSDNFDIYLPAWLARSRASSASTAVGISATPTSYPGVITAWAARRTASLESTPTMVGTRPASSRRRR